ncbi:MAG: DUF2865 domain-containing protein [Hyphomicrobiaceae bacterium]
MFPARRHLRSRLLEPARRFVSEEVRSGLAVGLAAVAVLALGAMSRAILAAAPAASVQTSGAYLTTSDQWIEQLTNPSAWRGGRFRPRQRALTRDEERREREQEQREARERQLREEREALEEALKRARELGREHGTFRTVCVRLCDGYFFPISFATTPDRFAADEAVCRARCRTSARLYVYPNPGGEPEQMFDVNGQPYTALRTAFLFRTNYDESCTCKPHPWEQEAQHRHHLYAERARATKQPVAAKVLQSPRQIEGAGANMLARPTPVASERPEGAMLLGAPGTKPTPPAAHAPAADDAPKRESRRSDRRNDAGGRGDWRRRAFSND